jgi:NADH pyrophosphatase NudC (nudix superfamily)
VLQYTNFKYCPKCGSAELTTLESNGMECITCGYVYFHNTASAVAALIEVPQKGILLVKRNHEPQKGLLDVPGGFVNYRESLENALRREIKEELSINLSSIEYFGSFPNVYKYKKVTYFTTDIFFRCTSESIPQIVLNDEISDYAFYPMDKLPFGDLAFDSTKEAFTYYKNTIQEG